MAAAKREFGEGPLYTIMNYIWWFFLGNFYFMLCNIPLIYVLLAFSGAYTIEYISILFIAALPMGPAITALFSVMGKLIREKDVNLTRDYFKAYRVNFRQSLMIWFFEVALIGILVVDIIFFGTATKGNILRPFFIIIIFLVIAAGLFIFPIISRFYLRTRDVIKIGFTYAIYKFKVTFFNIAAMILAVFIFIKFPGIGTLFISSIFCFTVMFYEKDILKQLEEQVTSSN